MKKRPRRAPQIDAKCRPYCGRCNPNESDTLRATCVMRRISHCSFRPSWHNSQESVWIPTKISNYTLDFSYGDLTPNNWSYLIWDIIRQLSGGTNWPTYFCFCFSNSLGWADYDEKFKGKLILSLLKSRFPSVSL